MIGKSHGWEGKQVDGVVGQSTTPVSTKARLIDITLEVDGSNFAEREFLVKIDMSGLEMDGLFTEMCPIDVKAKEI